MRVSPKRPRKNEPQGSARSQSLQVGPAGKGKTTTTDMLNGLSRRASVTDMARLQADHAANTARREAIAEGKTPQQVRGAITRARADSIKRSAKQAGVSPDTARRWVRGTQRAGKQAEKTGRPKLMRTMGGSKGVRAAQVEATSGVNLGKVRVRVDTGVAAGGTESRNINAQLDPAAMAHIAALIRDGDDAAAGRALEEHVLDQYGDGLSGIMRIDDIPGSTTWR